MTQKQLYFYRDYLGFTGGHLKVWDYFNHVKLSGNWHPEIYFSPESVWDTNNPWYENRSQVISKWPPKHADALFLAGMDWEALPQAWSATNPQVPVINLIQGARHASPDDPRYPFLSRPAIRICVSHQVSEALIQTGQVNGPVFTIPNGIDFDQLPTVKEQAERENDIVIMGQKQPQLAQSLLEKLENTNLKIRLITQTIPRMEFLDSINNSRITILLPHQQEGFYLPALEAMQLKTLVVCPNCIGNRDFCVPEVTCLVPKWDTESLFNMATRAANLETAERDALLAHAWQTSLRHTLAEERQLFYEILGNIEQLWQQVSAQLTGD